MTLEKLALLSRRNRFWVSLVILALIAAAIWTAAHFLQPAAPRHIVLASGLTRMASAQTGLGGAIGTTSLTADDLLVVMQGQVLRARPATLATSVAEFRLEVEGLALDGAREQRGDPASSRSRHNPQ